MIYALNAKISLKWEYLYCAAPIRYEVEKLARMSLGTLEIRIMKPKEPTPDILRMTTCESCYMAALIDGEGAIEIHKRDLYPQIRIGMRSRLPYELWKKYGGVINKRYIRDVPFYTWIVYNKSLLRNLVKNTVRHSRIKKDQLELVLKALKIRESKPLGWKDEMMRIKEDIARLNKQPPPDIDLESEVEENAE